MKKISKIYYLFQGKQLVPQIKISGKYLSRYGLDIGDKVEITLAQGEISIHKLNLSAIESGSTRKDSTL